MKTEAERIVATEIRKAQAQAAREFVRYFGAALACLGVGAILGVAFSWVAWVFHFAATSSWTVLVSPTFMAGATATLWGGLIFVWRLFHPKGGN